MVESVIIAVVAGGLSGGIVFLVARMTLSARLRHEIAQEYSRKVEDHVGRLESDLNYLIDKHKNELSRQEQIRHERWQIKRKACLHALKIVDAYYSNLDWDGEVEKQLPPNIAVARDCYNQLVLSCEGQKVLDAYKRCLGFYGPIKEEYLLDLRSAIREELGFDAPAESDRERVWLNRLTEAAPPAQGELNEMNPTDETNQEAQHYD